MGAKASPKKNVQELLQILNPVNNTEGGRGAKAKDYFADKGRRRRQAKSNIVLEGRFWGLANCFLYHFKSFVSLKGQF